jgi:hypothetical protein
MERQAHRFAEEDEGLMGSGFSREVEENATVNYLKTRANTS